MTERERFVRTLTCNSPDRPSYGDYFAYAATQQRWEREGLPAGLSRQGLYDHFGFDHVDIWGNDRLGLNDTILPAYQPCVLEETPEHTVRREGSGTVMRVLKNTPPPAMPQFLGYPVTDRSSWADFRQRLDPDTPGRFTPALAELARQSPQRTTPLGVWLGGTYGYIRNWMGVEKASCLFYDDPRLVEEMIEHLTGFYSALARRLFATGIELDWVMFWEDMAYNRASLLSPSLYRRYCLPFYRVMVERVRQHGVPVVGLDSDGNIEELLPLWLDAGITVMHPMEVAAGMDVRTARRRYGRNVTFLGGIDKRALANGRPAIDAEVVPKVRELRDSGGGFMVQCDHGVPPDIALDDFRYFHELVRRLFAEG